jgi:hypothetical protein
MKCLILTALGFACAALATPTPPLPPSQTDDLYQITDYYIFNVTIEEFIKTRELEPQPAAGTLDWTADGCSSSPDDPFGFDCTYPPTPPPLPLLYYAVLCSVY